MIARGDALKSFITVKRLELRILQGRVGFSSGNRLIRDDIALLLTLHERKRVWAPTCTRLAAADSRTLRPQLTRELAIVIESETVLIRPARRKVRRPLL